MVETLILIVQCVLLVVALLLLLLSILQLISENYAVPEYRIGKVVFIYHRVLPIANILTSTVCVDPFSLNNVWSPKFVVILLNNITLVIILLVAVWVNLIVESCCKTRQKNHFVFCIKFNFQLQQYSIPYD